MNNPKIEIDIDIAEILQKLNEKFDKIDERLGRLEIGQAEIKGKIETLDTKVDQLEKRIGNVEFSSRGILIGIGVVVLGGLAMLFGIGKP